MSLSRIADRRILPSPGMKTVVSESANVDAIIRLILEADRQSRPFTAQFARYLKGKTDLDTLRNVWKFTREHIEYVRDAPGNEIVKSPGATWKDRFGDCKSMSVFIGSILANLGYRYKYRVAFYDPAKPEQGHIYPIAYTSSGEVIVDAVNSRFNQEVRYWKAFDYEPASGRKQPAVAINGVGALSAELGTTLYIGAIVVGGFLVWRYIVKRA